MWDLVEGGHHHEGTCIGFVRHQWINDRVPGCTQQPAIAHRGSLADTDEAGVADTVKYGAQLG
jgi:hypothetical protein